MTDNLHPIFAAAVTSVAPDRRVRAIAPWRDRAPKSNPLVRCCWVCGKPDGTGFTAALQSAGYRIEPGKEIGYAHVPCMFRAQRQAKKRAERKARTK